MSFARIRKERENDSQVAEGAVRQRALYCCADGCNALWSVEGPMGKCCSAHAWKQPKDWKHITREVNSIITDIAATPPEDRITVDGTSERTPLDFKRDPIASTLATMLQPGQGTAIGTGSKAWAYALQRCDEAGMKLTPTQREAYKAVVARETIS